MVLKKSHFFVLLLAVSSVIAFNYFYFASNFGQTQTVKAKLSSEEGAQFLEISKEPEWKDIAKYEFNIKDSSQLPNTSSVIITVMITGKKSHWANQYDTNNLNHFAHPLCGSAKAWNEGLITLLSSSSGIETCESWGNGVVVKFESLLTHLVPLHDERMFVAEQFMRQFELHKKYKFVSQLTFSALKHFFKQYFCLILIL